MKSARLIASPARRFAAVAGYALAAIVVAAVAAGLVLRARLFASLPSLEGELALAGLAAPVKVERDALGVPTVRAGGRRDVAIATGFLHAQDRFFQMDLARRSAAGELAELFGPAVVKADREARVHRFRDVARRVTARLSLSERDILGAYTAGVNAGLAALGARPFEYLALRADPAPWREEDTILVVLAMFVELQDADGAHESALGVMHDVLPPGLFALLAAPGTEWDTPVLGAAFPTPALPGPEVFDLRHGTARAAALRSRSVSDARVQALGADTRACGADTPVREEEETALGSNNWAVDTAHSAGGRALLANDMHLGISVPNTWYRMALSWPDPGTPAGLRFVAGVTLPGTPAMVAGSNTRVAWGFTASYGDFGDLVVLEPDPHDPESYLTPDGPRKLVHTSERIRVKGRPDETLDVAATIWGPVIDHDHRGRARAFRWIAHDEEAHDLGLARLELAGTVEEALSAAAAAGTPELNFVCADAGGHIGWTVTGRIPRRVGFDGRLPSSWADGSRRWEGYLAAAEHPRVVDPPAGRIWTANARVVDGEALARIGDGGYVLGARARQIRDDLLALPRACEADLLAVQLDDRALFLARWRDLVLRTLTAEAIASHPQRAELRRVVETSWSGHASIESVGYRLVRGFRATVIEQVMGALTATCKQADARFSPSELRQGEGAVWRLVTERPPHLLDPRYSSWDEQLLAAADALLEQLAKQGGSLRGRTWGERNTARIQHPLSTAVPLLGRWLDMPAEPLPGDSNMPRFQAPAAGASERMVVSPGREREGIFHMPCGQSGHPLSPYYRAGHAAWVRGGPTPFLPGATVHTLVLRPQA